MTDGEPRRVVEKLAARERAVLPAQRVDESAAVFLRDDPLAGRLIAHMETERPYRDETMTIAKLAAQLGEPEYRLRRLINGQLGHRNFAAFLNGYRLDEVRAALSDPDQRQVPILTIALDAGFGSLGPFNRAFREVDYWHDSLLFSNHLQSLLVVFPPLMPAVRAAVYPLRDPQKVVLVRKLVQSMSLPEPCCAAASIDWLL